VEYILLLIVMISLAWPITAITREVTDNLLWIKRNADVQWWARIEVSGLPLQRMVADQMLDMFDEEVSA